MEALNLLLEHLGAQRPGNQEYALAVITARDALLRLRRYW